jgi:molybdopterin adenylyltransferase
MKAERSHPDELILGLVSISDRASRGVYEDQGLPALKAWFERALKSPFQSHERLIADERAAIEATLIELVDEVGCDLVLTTGDTGPARRDGEQMRRISLEFVPTAILSRQVGVLREVAGHAALILNLPGQPKAIAETLEGLKAPDGKAVAHGIFGAVPYCIDLIGGPYIETHDAVVKAFRPKSALRKPA